MNREIKFRAWDSIAGKMWEDVYFDGGHIYTIGPDGENASTMPRWEDNAIMQFTGLLDKNGKEIYESDVVRIWADPKHYGGYTGHDYAEAVVWNPQEARFELTEHGFYDFEFIQVIGNIHENKELLA